MLLWNKQRVKTPEARLDEIGCRHFCKARSASERLHGMHSALPHLEENIPNLFSHFEEWMKGATCWGYTFRFKIILLKG
jgi:hypothetical protein